MEKTKELLESLQKKQDQQLAFFNTLESIRWKFSSAFGIGAVIGILLSANNSADNDKLILGLLISLIVSFAGIVAQIRIFALVTEIWDRILILQSKEKEILLKSYDLDTHILETFSFPKVGLEKSKTRYILSVGMISCFVFASLFGISLGYGIYAGNF